MIWPRINSFQSKIRLLVATVSAGAVILVCVLLLVIDYARLRGAAIRSLSTEARMVGLHSTAALLFNDPAAGSETLGALKADPNVVAGEIYTADGRHFASYERRGEAPANPKSNWIGEAGIPVGDVGGKNQDYRLEGHWVVLKSHVVEGTRPLGMVVLVYDMRSVYARLQSNALVTLGVGAVATLLAIAAANRLQRSLIRPISGLMETARAIAQSKNYSIRATKYGGDEVAQFTDAFNDMIGQIELRTAELQRAREWFQVAVESAPNAMVMADPKGLIVLVNAQAESIFGHRREEMIGRPVEMLVPPRYRRAHPGHREGFFTAPRTRPMGEGRDLRGLRKDGSEFPIEIGLNPIQSDQGVMVLSAIVDITERKRAEEKLRRANEELTRQAQEMEQFVYTVSHDLKSPLVTASGFIGLMREAVDEGDMEEVKVAADHVSRAVARMGRLIQDLLELSRLGRVPNAPKLIDTRALLVELASEMRGRLQEAGMRLVIEDSIPAVHADRDRLTQVFENLISNAIKYAATGTDPTLTIGGVATDSEVRLFARDTGPGIAPEYHAKIFKLFQRLDTRPEGTGVGLAIVAQIAAVHGGRAWVESAPNHGATFWIALPAHPIAPTH